MTEQPATSHDEGAAQTPTELDRRRERMQVAQRGAEEANGAVTALDARIETTATQNRENEAALQTTLDRVATLKKAIKAAGRESEKLQTARKQARRDAAKAQQRAAAAESKYDRAVLADIVRREKDHDLSVHAASTPGSGDTPDQGPEGSSDAAPAPRTSRSTRARSTSARPAARTARETAARTTAARAGEQAADGNGDDQA